MDDTLTDPLAGRLIDGRYAVTARIAHGGMATVYLALDTRLDRQVALKVMHAELARDDDFVRRFIGEAKSVARLSHQNVVAVYDQGADGPFLYLAMEYVPGRTLKDLLLEHGRFSPAAALDIMAGILDGLAAAHASGIVHRDIKPENVLLTVDGRIKVADFGLATAQAAAAHTRSGLIIGTVAYLAPELVTGGVPVGPRSDVYSAGVLLYELLTGRQPYTGETPISVAYQHANSDIHPPSALFPEIPASVDRLVLYATERDPAARPADAAAFLKAIRQVRTELGPPAPAQAGRFGAVGPDGGARPTGLTGMIGVGVQGLAEAPWLDAAGSPGTGGWAATNGPNGTGGWAATNSPGNGGWAATNGPGNGNGRAGTNGPNGTSNWSGTDRLSGTSGWSTQTGGGTDGFGFGPDGRSHTMVVHREEAAEYLGRESFLGRWLFSRRLIVVVLLFALAAGLGVGGWWFTTGRYTPIPSLVGDTPAEATAALTQDGFKVTTGPEENSNAVAKGQVAGTSPSGRALKGSTIAILVSAGPFMSSVPAVRGDTLAAAKNALTGAHLSYVVQQVGSTLPKGTVTGTTPKANTSWPQTRPVTILVAGGPPMPNFVGMQKSAAAQAAASDHLTVTYVSASNTNQPPGIVTSQSPGKNTLVTSGETVTLTVSTGPQEVPLPNVIGSTIANARRTLEAAGFRVAVEGFDFFGVVWNEDPTPDGNVPAGSTITLFVNPLGEGGNGGGNNGGGGGLGGLGM